MALSGLRVDSYRAFGPPARLTLRPLTLVFGHNSRGKSALVRALPLLAASTTKDSGGPLNTQSAAVRGATFTEIKAQHHLSPTLGFELSWSDESESVARLSVRILGSAARGSEYVEQLQAWDASGNSLVRLLLKDDVQSLYDVETAGVPEPLRDVRVDFQGLSPAVRDANVPREAQAALSAVRARLESLRAQTYWLEAVRALPERAPAFKGKPAPVSSTGGSAAEQLAFSARSDQGLIEKVSRFYRHATRHDLQVDFGTVGGVTQFRVALCPEDTPAIRINILDTGEGMAQVLPVIVLGAMAERGELGESPVLIIEHPELHLHPRAHGDVARFLCDVARARPDARLVVETHSENFLSEVQLAVLSGTLPAEHVALHWVWSYEGGSAVDLLEMDSLARIEAWPPGVFSEDSELRRRILKAREQKVSREEADDA